MAFGIGAHANGKAARVGQRFDQFDAVGKATLDLLEIGAIHRIAAQGHDVGDSGIGKLRSGFQNLSRVAPTQVRCAATGRPEDRRRVCAASWVRSCVLPPAP